MLKVLCINPDLIKALAECGHGDKILIGDGNYPLDSKSNQCAKKIYLNLTHGIPLVPDVLRTLNEMISIERVQVMKPDTGTEPPIFKEFRDILDSSISFEGMGRFEFYKECEKEEVKVAIATGEQRIFANILITVGVV